MMSFYAKLSLFFMGGLSFLMGNPVPTEGEPLLLTKVAGQIIPKEVTGVVASKPGIISIDKSKKQCVLGEVLGIVNREQMLKEKEINLLKLAQKKAKSTSSFINEVENVEKTKLKTVELREEINFLESVKGAKIVSMKERLLVEKELTLKKEYLASYEKSISLYESTFDRQAIRRLQKLQDEIQERELSSKMSAYELTSESKGDVEWNVLDGSYVKQKEFVASVTDKSEIYIRVPGEYIEVMSRINKPLILVESNSRRLIQAGFFKFESEKSETGRNTISFLFKVIPDARVMAGRLLDSQMTFSLLLETKDEGDFFIKKVDIINALKEDGSILKSWRDALKKYYPAYRLKDVGVHQLLVTKS